MSLLHVGLLVFLPLATTQTTPLGPLTQHFQKWLNNNGYGEWNFSRPDLGVTGSYGGKRDDSQKVLHTPVIFVHGNSDGALSIPGPFSSGSSAQISYFQSKGYTSAELYVTTWGERSAAQAGLQAHSCETIGRLRNFTEAVMAYTESPLISVISHSMGVTLARKLVRGGHITPLVGQTSCDLGPSLVDRVEVFIGIGGANYGMCSCGGQFADLELTCNRVNGFWPGDVCGMNVLTCDVDPLQYPCPGPDYSALLNTMNNDRVAEGKHVYSLWSDVDDIIGNGDMVWARPTSLIPGSSSVVVQNLTHMQSKELTADIQYEMLTDVVPRELLKHYERH